MNKNNFYQIYGYKNSIILLLLIILFLIYFKPKNEIPTPLLKENITPIHHIIHNYRLYNNTDNPYISILIEFSNLNFIDDNQIKILSDLSKHLFIDIQIILLYNSSLDMSKSKEIKSFIKEKNIEIHSFITNEWIKGFFNIFKYIKGKFFVLVNDRTNIKIEDFRRIFNLTKGSKDNIFKLDFLKTENSYLIRTKILKDIVDREINFKNFKDIINYVENQPIDKLNYIPITFCPDNYYTSLTYTSMISILTTKGYYTYILFYLIIPLGFSHKNILFFETLYEQFDYFNITFLQMDNRYEKAYTNRYLTKNAFYRLSLGELLPYMDKIIYLDSDTISFKDLTNLYKLNFMGKIFIAKINTFNSKNDFVINTGVLLLNLKGMRKIKVEKKVLTLLNNGFKDPSFHDQAIINKFFKEYIGFLPPEYNTYTFDFNIIKKYRNDSGRIYDFDSLYFSFKYPSIVHFRGHPYTKTYDEEDWYYFARRSKYFYKRSHNLTKIFNFTI